MAKMPPVQAESGTTAGGPSFNLNAYDVISGHGSAVYGAIAGFFAGVLLWVPVFVVLYFNQFILYLTGAIHSSSGAGIRPASLVPYIVATGLVGVGLSVLRRISARIGWYKEVAGYRLGINGVVATIGGMAVCIGFIASGNQAGILLIFLSIGVLIGGFLVNTAWEAVHNRFLVFHGAAKSDAILQRVALHELERSPYFKPETIDSLRVERGKILMRATWKSDEERSEAVQALRTIPGITTVQFERQE